VLPFATHTIHTQSYTETEHIIDLYETITIKEAPADLFAGTRTNPAVIAGTAFDACRPAGYEFTGIWSYSTPTNGAHTPGMCLHLVEVFGLMSQLWMHTYQNSLLMVLLLCVYYDQQAQHIRTVLDVNQY
jgi:hypothetical protein